jgi:hypothetical protein
MLNMVLKAQTVTFTQSRAAGTETTLLDAPHRLLGRCQPRAVTLGTAGDPSLSRCGRR